MTPTPTAIREYDRTAPDGDATRTATFALGCFWGPDAEFGAMEDVVRTRVGYAGGTKAGPTYHALGDHTEAVQVDYVPDGRSFADLLDTVFANHDPTRQTRKTQYQNIVFAMTPDHHQAIDAYLEEHDLPVDAIETRVERLEQFYPAEDYHQKYNLRSNPRIVNAFEEAGYGDADLRESPAAAKLNGQAAGHDVPPIPELGIGDDPLAGRR